MAPEGGRRGVRKDFRMKRNELERISEFGYMFTEETEIRQEIDVEGARGRETRS